MKVYQYRDLVGNRTVISMLQKSVHNRSLKNFVILSGVMGTGKSSCAEITALSLTCEKPNNGEPCLKCENCKTNLQAFKTSGQSMNVVKMNLGAIASKKDKIDDMMTEIFKLQGMTGNNVYILGEAHALSSNDQTALLEEIDSLSENTYVILTTSKLYKLIPELRSRTVPFVFGRLTPEDSRMLFERTCLDMGVKQVSKEIENMVMKYGRGVARDIVNLIEFIHKNSPTEQELRSFLHYIGNEAFIGVFYNMKQSMRDMILATETMIKEHTPELILDQLKEFIVNVLFYLEGGESGIFSKSELELINEVFDKNSISKIANAIDKMSTYDSTDADLKLMFVRLRQIMVGSDIGGILSENKRNANRQTVEHKIRFAEEKQLREGQQTGVTKLSAQSLMRGFGDGS